MQVTQIVMPPLRKRTEGFSPEAMMHLQSYAWPGNVRELENVVHRCVVMADSHTRIIEADMLPSIIREGRLS